MALKPSTKDDTQYVSPSLSLSSTPTRPPSISTSTPLYSDSETTLISHNYTTPNNFRWPTNQPNHVSNYVGVSSIPHGSTSSTQTENLINSDFHLGGSLNLTETHLNRNPFFHFDSDMNQNENKSHSILRLGIEKTHDPSRVNSIMPPFSSSTQWYHNRISSSSKRVEKNETSRFDSGDSTLNQNMLDPVTKNKLVQVEPVKGKLVLVNTVNNNELKERNESVDKKRNQLDLIQKRKSKVEARSPLNAKGSDKIDNAAGEGKGKRDGSGDEIVEVARSNDEELVVESLKSWNLRPRKQVTKSETKVNILCSRGGRSWMGVASARVSKPRSAKLRAHPSSERPTMKDKQRFVFTLSKEEIKHDFMVMTEEKPPKKPLRRPKNVQKNLDVLFPGMYLTNVLPEKYKVIDNPPPLKC